MSRDDEGITTDGDGTLDVELSNLVATAIPVLRRVAPGMMGSLLRERCRTSDLVQSALVEAIVSMPTFRGQKESEFVGWTMRIMEHNVLDRQRRLLTRKRRVDREQGEDIVPLQSLASKSASPSEVAINREELLRIAKAMRQLPDDQRRILQIVALRGCSHAEAARILGRSEGACRVLLGRARARLIATMARHEL